MGRARTSCVARPWDADLPVPLAIQRISSRGVKPGGSPSVAPAGRVRDAEEESNHGCELVSECGP